MSDGNATRIECNVEGDTIILKLDNETVLYLTKDEARRLYFQAAEATMDTFDVEADGNIVMRNMEGVIIERNGITLTYKRWSHLYFTLEECVALPDEQDLPAYEDGLYDDGASTDDSVADDLKKDNVNWMQDGF